MFNNVIVNMLCNTLELSMLVYRWYVIVEKSPRNSMVIGAFFDEYSAYRLYFSLRGCLCKLSVHFFLLTYILTYTNMIICLNVQLKR